MKENSFAISGLKRKRGELASHIMTVEAQIKTLRGDMAAVDRSLVLLTPRSNPKPYES